MSDLPIMQWIEREAAKERSRSKQNETGKTKPMAKQQARSRFQRIRVKRDRHVVITPVGRVSFPAVFEPVAFEDEEKKTYKVNLLFDPDDLKVPYAGKKSQTPSIKKVLLNVKQDQWGADKAKWPRFTHASLRNGDELKTEDGEIFDGYEGKVFLVAKTGEKFPPKVVDRDGSPITDPEKFYGGCYARAQLLARPYHTGTNCGVRFTLLQLMKVKDGDRFGLASDVFDHEDPEFDEDDAAGGADDEDF